MMIEIYLHNSGTALYEETIEANIYCFNKLIKLIFHMIYQETRLQNYDKHTHL